MPVVSLVFPASTYLLSLPPGMAMIAQRLKIVSKSVAALAMITQTTKVRVVRKSVAQQCRPLPHGTPKVYRRYLL